MDQMLKTGGDGKKKGEKSKYAKVHNSNNMFDLFLIDNFLRFFVFVDAHTFFYRGRQPSFKNNDRFFNLLNRNNSKIPTKQKIHFVELQFAKSIAFHTTSTKSPPTSTDARTDTPIADDVRNGVLAMNREHLL